jgi:hypothetical protein
VAFRWLGSATVPQLLKLLDDAEAAVREEQSPLAQADRLHGEKKWAEAASAYEKALGQIPKNEKALRARTVESWLNVLTAAGERDTCARVAVQQAPSLPRGPSFANAVLLGLGCASATSNSASTAAKLDAFAIEAIGLPSLLADDRSSLYELLVSRRQESADAAGVQRWAREWLRFLEAEAAKAPSPEARAAFDAHRVQAALALGTPERSLQALEASERDLPEDYNAPARLALLYRAIGRTADGLSAVERALAKVYGPRRLRVLETKVSLLEQQGNLAAASSTAKEALQVAQGFSREQVSANTLRRWEDTVARLNSASP